MITTLKSIDISKKLGVTTQTIRRWVSRYPDYFSEDAVAPHRPQSIYTLEDFRILLTIYDLSVAGHSVEAIGQKLAEGYRYEGTLDEIFSTASEAKTVRNKDTSNLETRVAELLGKTEQLEKDLIQAQQHNIDLIAELTTTKYQLGVAEGELKAVKEYLLPNKSPNQ